MLSTGKISFRLNKLVESSNYYHDVCFMIKNMKGENSEDLIPIYQFLGRIEQSNSSLSNHSKVIEFYLTAHNITNKIYETHSTQIVQTGQALATVYSIIGTVNSENEQRITRQSVKCKMI